MSPPLLSPKRFRRGVVVDYNGNNEVVGVEMLRLSERSSVLNLSALEFEAK